MKPTTASSRRAASGVWVVRASSVPIGLATAIATVHPYCAADANGPFATL